MRRLSIADPCAAPWEQMEGAGRTRRCAACDREVHDLSARTEVEATALLLVFGSRGLCVRFERDAEGGVRFAPEPRRAPPPARAGAGLVVAAALGVAACGPAAQAPPAAASAPPPPAPLVVEVAAPAPPASAVAAVEPVDTDGDGVPDDHDACPTEPGRGSAAGAQNGCPARVVVVAQGAVIVIERIRFGRGGRAVDARSRAIIEEVARVLQQNPDILKVAVKGHASRDEPGAAKLGEARAKAVVAALAALDVDPARLVPQSFGMDQPIASNATKDGHEQNRRVEFEILESKSCPGPGAAAP
jgi:outer membrane protein OmpA-like peptidoglycan-associated protein